MGGRKTQIPSPIRGARWTKVWRPIVPSWEREFCKSVGIQWKDLCEAKLYTPIYEDILNWKDSAGEEAFSNAKQRYWAQYNGINCEIALPNPDLYIDEIDWDSHEPHDPRDCDWVEKAASEHVEEEESEAMSTPAHSTTDHENGPGLLTGWEHINGFGWNMNQIHELGWEGNDNGQGNFTAWEQMRETEANANMGEKCPAYENAMETFTDRGNNTAYNADGCGSQDGVGWTTVVGKNRKKQRGHGRNARPTTKIFCPREQNFTTGRDKQLHAPVHYPYQNQPFAPWNSMLQIAEQSCRASKAQSMQKKNRDYMQSDVPVNNNYTEKK
eukprot:Gb_19719 [translate_table: standard]